MTSRNKEKGSFFSRRRNSIVAVAVILAVLIAGCVAVSVALREEPDDDGQSGEIVLLPGEALYGKSYLVYDRIDRAKLKKVSIHNPDNASTGEQYVDWALEFAYDEDDEQYVFLSGQDYAELDETAISYFAVSVGTMSFTSRVEDHCEDFSPYGLDYASPEEAKSITVECVDGKKHVIYVGNMNPSGTGYYVRSMDTAEDEDGNEYVRDSVYLLTSATTEYLSSSAMAHPASIVTPRLSYPTQTGFSVFALLSNSSDLNIIFEKTKMTTSDAVFGGVSAYKSTNMEGFYSSSRFETRISRFKELMGDEVLEYATELRTEVDEDTGKEYSYYYFSDEILAKYGLDPATVEYMMFYTVQYEDAEEEPVQSEVYFSKKQPDGFYYAYSLNFNTICRVDDSVVDFLEWSTIDFLDSYIYRLSIAYCERLTVDGTLNGVPFREVFRGENDAQGILRKVFSEGKGEYVELESYRSLFQEIYSTAMRGNAPEDLDIDALKEQGPYLTLSIDTTDVTIYKKDSNGNDTSIIDRVLPGITRTLRFYRYSNGRALVTIETIDENGESSGENGAFYVTIPRLDKLVSDAYNVNEGLPVDPFARD